MHVPTDSVASCFCCRCYGMARFEVCTLMPQVIMHVDKDSKEAQRAAAKEAAKAAAPLAASAGGLDAVLSEFEKKKKVRTGLPFGNRHQVRLVAWLSQRLSFGSLHGNRAAGQRPQLADT